ncbi:MAG TPA: hypothetical protein VEA59_06225 [Patescibacteria group bacterium]|nr:hypothetical protein [Patescibacteria group bacterium]
MERIKGAMKRRKSIRKRPVSRKLSKEKPKGLLDDPETREEFERERRAIRHDLQHIADAARASQQLTAEDLEIRVGGPRC